MGDRHLADLAGPPPTMIGFDLANPLKIFEKTVDGHV